jgi:ribosomal protein S18 acetylase RimI-like enzyme
MTSVRRLQPDDATPYRALMLDAYARHPDAFTSSAAERGALPLAWWQARLDNAPLAKEIVFGAFDGEGKSVGVAGLAFETREKARHKAQLFGMAVSTSHRSHGVGAALVQAALTQARSRSGVRLVQLTVTQGNASAQRLYERFGFLPFGVEPMAVAVGEGYVAKVHMWCDLCPA